MKLAEFRDKLTLYTRGDINPPDFSELSELASEVAREIHIAVTPLEKIEIDTKHFEADYFIDDKYFVRKFKDLEDNNNFEIDFFDQMLIRALLCGIALKRCIDTNRYKKYIKDYNKALINYELNNFDERSYDLDSSLRAKGWAKPYDINSAIDNYYVWDEGFISNLDYYMANIPKTRDLSYAKFIKLFFDYQNKLITPDREDLRELDRYMKNKIIGKQDG
ncbi:hypothetical protein [Campylobacter sp. RM16192]|uniref:hypothetical protein n=1 Tax=Campylobacter sp. RM16192 TaxID=1660080 RepID=UPI0014521C44|nr:hypothetical protein [Campylobacter sp. RM16192]QCD52507.1 hypothetical protein CDOMC_0884 [Campylobacter sp. RM16192]